MDQPTFSVIVPAYNAEHHMRHGLDSVRSQSFHDYELIVVCDSCHDRTEQIAKSYDARTLTVTYGCDGLTRDAGLDIASGKWILFMDDDDWYLHEFAFQQLADVIGKHDEDVLAFSYIRRGEGYVRQTHASLYDYQSVTVWNKCWRHDSIGKARFGNTKYCSDRIFYKRMLDQIHRIAIWDMPLYYYNYMREGSQTELYVNGKIRMGNTPHFEGGMK